MNKNIFRCKNCVMVSTRPRLTFNNEGLCSACVWSKEKKKINWKKRIENLKALLNKHKKINKNNSYDCLVPVGGGKDGSYVAYNLKHKYKMRPLCITFVPSLILPIGEKNIKNFVNSGYEHVAISPDVNVMYEINKIGFEEYGFPYYGWMTACTAGALRFAIDFNITLIVYGEDGELEYGGKSQTKKNPIYSAEYIKKILTEGHIDKILKKLSKKHRNNVKFFTYPTDKILRSKKIEITHWSSYENWDPYRNYITAKKFCGLQESISNNLGTFTNFAQNDQALVALHTYIMYLKFGFGRASADAAIEVRRGAMDRKQAMNLVNLYDGIYPEEFLETYLKYFKISEKKFNSILDRFANKKIFEKKNNRWILKKKIL